MLIVPHLIKRRLAGWTEVALVFQGPLRGLPRVRVPRRRQPLFVRIKQWWLIAVHSVSSQTSFYYFKFFSKSHLQLSQTSLPCVLLLLMAGVSAMPMVPALEPFIALLAKVAPPLTIKCLPSGFVRETSICLQANNSSSVASPIFYDKQSRVK